MVRRTTNRISAVLISAVFLTGGQTAWLAGDPLAGDASSTGLHDGRTIAADVAGTPLRLLTSMRQLGAATRYAIPASIRTQAAAVHAVTSVRRCQFTASSTIESPHGSRAPPAPSFS